MRPAVPLLSIAAVLALCAGSPAQAQSVPAPGARVRVTSTAGTVTGPLQRFDADTVVVAGRAIGRASMLRLELSRGRGSRWLLGGGIGLVVGGVGTYLVLNTGGSTALCDRSANQDAIASRECAGLTLLGGVAGAALGALVGGMFRSERWTDVPAARLTIVPERSGLRVGATVSIRLPAWRR